MDSITALTAVQGTAATANSDLFRCLRGSALGRRPARRSGEGGREASGGLGLAAGRGPATGKRAAVAAWQQFADRQPTEAEKVGFRRHRRGTLCLPLGVAAGIEVVDIDT